MYIFLDFRLFIVFRLVFLDYVKTYKNVTKEINLVLNAEYKSLTTPIFFFVGYNSNFINDGFNSIRFQ